MKRSSLAFVLLLTIVFLAVILWQLDYRLVILFIRKSSPLILILSFVLYTLTYWLRALRWRILLGIPLSLFSLFHIVCLHTLSNNLFPFRSGELTLPYFLKRFHKIQLPASLSSLLLARVSDMISLGLLFLAGLVALGYPGGKNLLFLIPLIMILLVVSPWIMSHILSLAVCLPFLKKKSVEIGNLSEEIRGQWRGVRMLQTNLMSLAIWSLKFLAFFLLLKEMAKSTTFPLNYWKVVLGTSALTTVLPIHSIGGIGTYEAGWIGAFIIMGMSRKIAVTMAFLFHMVLLLFSVLLGVPSYFIVPLRSGRE